MFYDVKESRSHENIGGINFHQIIFDKRDSRYGNKDLMRGYWERKKNHKAMLYFERIQEYGYSTIEISSQGDGFSIQINNINHDAAKAVEMAIAATKEWYKVRK